MENRFKRYRAREKSKEVEGERELGSLREENSRLREENARLREFRTYMEETSLNQVLAFEKEKLRREDPGALQRGTEELHRILDE